MKKQPTLGLCMIVKNEEEVIGRCLESVKGVFDEIVMVDTGSTDKTKEIMKKYTDKIYDFKWIYDFAAARNYSFSKSTCDYIMWLDADDVLYPEDAKKIKELKKHLSDNYEAYRMYYSYAQDKHDNTTLSQQRVRIIRNPHQDIWVGKIHEVIPMEKWVPVLDITVHHKKTHVLDPKRNLNIYDRMENNNDYFDTRDLFLYSVELSNDNQLDKALSKLNEMMDRKEDYYRYKFYYDRSLLTRLKVLAKMGKTKDDRKEAILTHLRYFAPTASLCCELGNVFNEERNLEAAKFWYQSALEIAKTQPSEEIEYNEYCPYCGLAYIAYCQRDIEKALEYNTKAIELFPSHPMAQRYRQLFLDTYYKVQMNKKAYEEQKKLEEEKAKKQTKKKTTTKKATTKKTTATKNETKKGTKK